MQRKPVLKLTLLAGQRYDGKTYKSFLLALKKVFVAGLITCNFRQFFQKNFTCLLGKQSTNSSGLTENPLALSYQTRVSFHAATVKPPVATTSPQGPVFQNS